MDVNAATEHITGYSREELIGKDFSITSPSLRGRVQGTGRSSGRAPCVTTPWRSVIGMAA